MFRDKNGEPVFPPGGLVILAGLVIWFGIQTWWGNRQINAEIAAQVLPIESDPLCIRQIDKAPCEAWWRARIAAGDRDPLGILPPNIPQPRR